MPTLPVGSIKGSASYGTSYTGYLYFFNGYSGISVTEVYRQVILRTVLTLSRFYVVIMTNTITATTTLRIRKNGADANQNVSIPDSATGLFEDTTNTDSFSSGDKISLQLITGGTGTSIVVKNVGARCYTPTDYPVFIGGATGFTISTALTTFYVCINGQGLYTPTESYVAWKQRTSGILKNLMVYISSNSRTTTSTFGVDVNPATAGSVVVSIGAGVTGSFEDISNTDSITSSNYPTLYCTLGNSWENLVIEEFKVEFYASTKYCDWEAIQTGLGFGVATGVLYPAIFGAQTTTNTIETSGKQIGRCNFELSNFMVNVTSNTITATSIIHMRKNGTDGNSTISIGGSATGWFEDTSNKDTFLESDYFNLEWTPGGTGTSLTFNAWGGILLDLLNIGWHPEIQQPVREKIEIIGY